MKINPIQSSTNKSYNQNFTGVIAVNGSWPKTLEDSFIKSNAINKLADEGYNIIGTLKTKQVETADWRHSCGDILYKLKLNLQKENPTVLDSVKNLLGLSSHTINKKYHSEETIKDMLDNTSLHFFHKRINK